MRELHPSKRNKSIFLYFHKLSDLSSIMLILFLATKF